MTLRELHFRAEMRLSLNISTSSLEYDPL